MDDTNYADWYTYFNKAAKEVDQNESFTLNLKGYQGMGGTEARNIEGVKVGIWKDGAFEQAGTSLTNKNGNAEITIDEPGNYIVTAYGTVNDTWKNWDGSEKTAECPIMAPVCEVTVNALPQVHTTAKVFITVVNKGKFAVDKNGKTMVDRKVTVADINEDGVFSYDEAMVAAHGEYCTAGEAGYAASKSGWVTKLWAEDNPAASFIHNNVAIPSVVTEEAVTNGDRLYCAIMTDNATYSDYYGSFNVESKSVNAGEAFTLTLKAVPAMVSGDSDGEAVSIADAKIGTVASDGGEFLQIQHKETDSEGKVTLKFNESGTYYVTTEDAVIEGCMATNWNLMDLGGDPSVYGYMDFDTYDSFVAYTDAD